ncbi:siphovirus Gp157 family protein [Streptococcus pneumoniae]|uniref:siphovirus Gp157 family protein n=1 Tax=Streptococcus pneumoniae TaxID=1313 RepID=UPI0021B6D419|nr:siphovirus Gp157 family protein [Streptococcus pneumoniae]
MLRIQNQSRSTKTDLPKKYFTKKATLAPDKKTLKELLKSGKKVKGAELVRTEKLVIK